MAVAFEHYGQTVAPAAPPQPARTPQKPPVPAYVPPQAQAQAAGQVTGLRDYGLLGARVLLMTGMIATLGAHMASDGSWFQVWWWQMFGWYGLVDLPLVLLPLAVILVVCWLVVWGVTAVVVRARG